MDLIKLLLLVVLMFTVSLIHGVEGRISISKGEDLELERQLKILNKPPIKTIQGKTGDIFDCVDIHKQPAFDHPLLKNHKIQMEPTSFPKGRLNGETSTGDEYSSFKLESIDCPQGTVPIRRTQKEDLIRAKSFSRSYSVDAHPLADQFSGQYRALAKTQKTDTPQFYGIQADINIYNPAVGDNQTSSALMWIENGFGDQLNSIHAGWTVAPRLFDDFQTRLYIYWSVDGNNKTGCFNLLCPGFIQIDPNNPIGQVLSPTSSYDGPQYIISIFVFQDLVTGDWWLTTTDEKVNFGYWPKELLPQLSEGASVVAWGGLTKGFPDGPSPPMGNGDFPDGNFRHSCYFRNTKIRDGSNILYNPKKPLIDTVIDSLKCYNIQTHTDENHAVSALLFGGPGGICD